MQYFALRNKYPLETEGMVKIALDYFDKFLSRFKPVDRSEIAFNLEKRAAMLGVDVSRDWIDNYRRPFTAPNSYSPDFEMNMELRKQACLREKTKVVVGCVTAPGAMMIEKLAAKKNQIRPLAMMKAIEEFDKTAGFEVRYDREIADPVITVFGSLVNPQYDMEKVAGDLTNYDLVRMSRNEEAMKKLASVMPSVPVDAFKKDPVGTVKGMSEKDRFTFAAVV